MSDCLEGWTYFSHTGYCYKLITSKKTWQKARKHCQKIGKEEGGNGELASIHSSIQQAFLVAAAAKFAVSEDYAESSFWIGLQSQAK